MSDGRQSLSVFAFVCLCLLFVVTGSACGKKEAQEGDEPTKYQSQAGLEQLSRQAAQESKEATPKFGAINSRFSSAKDITASSSPTAKDIDTRIRPVLVKLFGDARLISAKGPEAPKRDGEVVEDRLLYSVRTLLTEAQGDALHDTFHSAGFVDSPRLGRKPTHSRGNVYMSLMRSTSLRGYSFVIIVDTFKQQIEIESYKLGSKYDRM
jgi:hypothetical protein